MGDAEKVRKHVERRLDTLLKVQEIVLAGNAMDAVDILDAALRRAKAEEWREAAKLSRMRAHDHALAISRADDVLHRGVEFAKQIEAERIAEAFDARAAQIEQQEGPTT